ncbi:unnamed protein product [Meloidogyne enterolobii]|uniref:Uncharacterized protein n=1 Tax=Meloidogyne enterolobii TaxID=390850 RepID=A0ACB1AY39_MELEN
MPETVLDNAGEEEPRVEVVAISIPFWLTSTRPPTMLIPKKSFEFKLIFRFIFVFLSSCLFLSLFLCF